MGRQVPGFRSLKDCKPKAATLVQKKQIAEFSTPYSLKHGDKSNEDKDSDAIKRRYKSFRCFLKTNSIINSRFSSDGSAKQEDENEQAQTNREINQRSELLYGELLPQSNTMCVNSPQNFDTSGIKFGNDLQDCQHRSVERQTQTEEQPKLTEDKSDEDSLVRNSESMIQTPRNYNPDEGTFNPNG